MKSHLNFLPEDQRSKVKKIMVLLIVEHAAILLTILIIIFSGAIFGIRLLMDQEVSRIQLEKENSKVVLNGSEDDSIEGAIQDLNATTLRLASIQDSFIEWTSVFTKFAELLPKGITLEAVDFDAGSNKATIKGIADTRDNYFIFDTTLKSSEYVESADLPLSLLKEDIPFNVEVIFTDSFFTNE